MCAIKRERNLERNADPRSGACGAGGLWDVVEGHCAGKIHLRPFQRFKLNRVILLGAFSGYIAVQSVGVATRAQDSPDRSEEHTSELQSLMRISYAVFCLKKTKKHKL